MNAAAIPPIRVEQAFRVEKSEFIQRGTESIARSEAAHDWIPADVVIASLESKGAAARERRSSALPID